MELSPGALIAGRYRVERKVGSGGMGEVWAGEHVAIGVRVALKTLLPAAACDHQIVARFKREAYLLGKIRSDYVSRVVDFVSDQRFGLVLVMEFVEGDSLGQAIQARRFSVEEALDLGVDILGGLCDLHRAHVVHRDLKPDNIILEPLASGGRRAMIVDFGVGRMISSGEDRGDIDDEITGITHADMAVGTIAYMAPEQLLSSRDATGSADLYALGAILYRAVAGKHVFGDLDDVDCAKKKLSSDAAPLELPRFDRVAKGFASAVGRALSRKPAGRFPSAQTMREELVALRDVARALALDLDAATEEADPSLAPSALEAPATTPEIDPPTGIHEAALSMPEAGPDPTLREERPPALQRAAAGAADDPFGDEETTISASTSLEPPASPSGSPARAAPPPVEIVAPSPETRRAPPEPPRRAQTVAVVAALICGVLLGFLAHWSLWGPTDAAAPAPSCAPAP
jgi:eukaryotic-like serine/threonine-protein kinase